MPTVGQLSVTGGGGGRDLRNLAITVDCYIVKAAGSGPSSPVPAAAHISNHPSTAAEKLQMCLPPHAFLTTAQQRLKSPQKL